VSLRPCLAGGLSIWNPSVRRWTRVSRLWDFLNPAQIIGAARISVVYARHASTYVDRVWLIPGKPSGHRRPFQPVTCLGGGRRFAPLVGEGLSKAAGGYAVEIPVRQCSPAYLGQERAKSSTSTKYLDNIRHIHRERAEAAGLAYRQTALSLL
jgi:hypothetical protein